MSQPTSRRPQVGAVAVVAGELEPLLLATLDSDTSAVERAGGILAALEDAGYRVVIESCGVCGDLVDDHRWHDDLGAHLTGHRPPKGRPGRTGADVLSSESDHRAESRIRRCAGGWQIFIVRSQLTLGAPKGGKTRVVPLPGPRRSSSRSTSAANGMHAARPVSAVGLGPG